MKEGIQNILASRSKTFLMFCSCVLIICALWSLRDKDCSNRQEICSFHDRSVVMQGVIDAEPDRRIASTRYVVETVSVVGWGDVSGKLLLDTKNYPEYYYGDVLRISCKLLRPNKNEEAFRYDKYLAKENIFITCSYPKFVEKIGQKDKIFTYVFRFKEVVAQRIEKLWPEPESSFMAGLLYGSRSGLPIDVKTAFSKTGISHIVAVSGYNIAIIAQVMMSALIAIRLHRRQAFWVVAGVLIFFVVFTGASASVVRAGIMGILVLLGEYIGRPARVGYSLVIAATVMVVINPFIFLWDIGFQLSFLSTAGLVYVGPIIKKFLPKIMDGIIGQALVATLAAQVATLPLILYYFGQLSISAPLVNVLVLWCIPWLMLLGFIAVALSFVVFPLAQVVAWIAQAGLAYVINIALWFGKQSWSAAHVSFSLWVAALVYLVLIGLIIYGKKSESV